MKKFILAGSLLILLTVSMIAFNALGMTEYTISSGTYANGDKPIDEIPFIEYSITAPSAWIAEESGYWENEKYYTIYKDNATRVYAGESYIRDYIDATILSSEGNITTLEFGGYIVKLRIIEANDGFHYYFYIPVDTSYCLITGLSSENSLDQQDEFFDIVKSFEVR